MVEKIIRGTYSVADSQSVAGHKMVLRRSLATAHHADTLKPAQQPAQPAPQTQQTPQSTQTAKPK
jgi:hypothetical protein